MSTELIQSLLKVVRKEKAGEQMLQPDRSISMERSLINEALRSSSQLPGHHKRVTMAIVEPFVADSDHNMGRRYLGEKTAGRIEYIVKGKPGRTLVLCNIISRVLAAFSIFDSLDTRFSYLILIFTLPLFVGFISLSNAKILPRLCKSFDTITPLGISLVAFGMYLPPSRATPPP